MNKEQLIDEIDWLISEIKPGLKLTGEHLNSFRKVDIACPCSVITRSFVSVYVEALKNKRELLT